MAQGDTEAIISATGGGTFFGKTVALLAEPEEVGHLRKVWPLLWMTLSAHLSENVQR